MFFVGIDIGKRRHAVTILSETGKAHGKGFAIPNDQPGFGQLQAALDGLEGEVHIGLEATGHYWLALYAFLLELERPVIVLNPLQIAAYRKSGLRQLKTDRRDAFWIADFLRVWQPQPTPPSLPLTLQLRELSRFRFHLNGLIGECKNKVLSILDRVFPEYERLFRSPFLQSSRQLLQRAVSAQQMAELDLGELTQLLHQASRGRFGADKARQIHAQAACSVGIGFLVDALQIEMGCLLDQIELLQQQRQRVDEHLAELLGQLAEGEWLLSIPGIGPSTGAALLGEIGEVTRFESVEQLVAYAGIDASVHQSGQFTATQTHMSKRGSPYLRHALWQAAFMAIQSDPGLKAYYEKRLAEGKHHNVILGAICRKLLARIFAVLTQKRAYVKR